MELLFAIKTSLIICAIYACFWDDMIFGKIGQWLNNKLSTPIGVYIAKPIYSCIICMSSLWGGGIYIYYSGLSISIIPHILIVAGINVLISGIVYLAYEREIIK